MSFLNKFGIGVGAGSGTGRDVSRPIPQNGGARSIASVPAVGAPRPPEAPGSTRISNGLKEFLWNLDGLGRGTMLDLGPAWQTTLSFFIERGFRVSSEDILRGWKEFLAEEEALLRSTSVVGGVLAHASGSAAVSANDALDMTPSARAVRFLTANLQY